jgi:hypothetical protein
MNKSTLIQGYVFRPVALPLRTCSKMKCRVSQVVAYVCATFLSAVRGHVQVVGGGPPELLGQHRRAAALGADLGKDAAHL